MQTIHPISLFLLLLTLIGYITLSIWLILSNENKKSRKQVWLSLVIGLPFIGSTIYFVSHFIENDTRQITSSK